MGNPATCYLNGELMALASARISPLDRGFLFGDGVYEVIPCYGGVPFRLDAHLRRLANSLAAIDLADPLSPRGWTEVFEQVCRANGGGDQSLYLQVTRGCPERRTHEFPGRSEPTVFVMSSPLPAAGAFADGLHATLREDLRWARCDIKAVALLPNVLLRQEAIAAGADEAILHRDGQITEGAASTVFLVRDGELATPALHPGLLPGITREVILELAEQHGLPFRCRPIGLDELRSADEVWLSSATKEVAPVLRIDGDPVGNGSPGPVFAAMRGWFTRLREATARGRQP
ncbi:MAG: D-amino acid aminotransferase [Halorhodospira halophila]|uniref:D-amino acid aminotransferase n=1 Tax=Halorhodospira TaxID=85108 RepID=UPI00191233A0|nr:MULTISPECIES: D-amino acid aminotransferase [Halorhodospira]MBK5937366.1 D-amino acid aminotransferase [Halorhodospira halophila]MCC3751035.1 D-amino acid aminotransferase [Halorhodospira halophila]MCG5526921.1 D-amino acid aminotransferase [Halorhodospira halophila]MCG5533179.1 D-amino acid aminotransferase [Halorhodospira sp. 9621]MCG5537933.1 D-amino acid aminotransferase [Halorhodospira sp. 9622]